MILHSWVYYGTGILFCLSGAWLFYKNAFEEEKKMSGPILLLAGGVLLIGLGTAKYFKLIAYCL